MVKEVPPRTPWRSLMLRHGDLKQRLYYLPARCASPACIRLAVERWLLFPLGSTHAPCPGHAWQDPPSASVAAALHHPARPPLAEAAARFAPLCSHVQPYQVPGGAANGTAAAARGVAKKPSKPAKKRPRKR